LRAVLWRAAAETFGQILFCEEIRAHYSRGRVRRRRLSVRFFFAKKFAHIIRAVGHVRALAREF
jgi:hypothetical protein